jgi:phosphate/sulfate permease
MKLFGIITIVIISIVGSFVAAISIYFIVKEWKDYKEEKYQEHLLEGKKNLRKKLFPKSRMNDPIYDWPLLKATCVKSIRMPKPRGIPNRMKFVYNGKTQELKNDSSV